MTLYGIDQVSRLKAWIVRIIGASNQDVRLAGLASKLGLQVGQGSNEIVASIGDDMYWNEQCEKYP